MENKFLLDLTVKYGLSSQEVSKLADVAYQSGFDNVDAEGAQRALNYVCKMKLVSKPMEEVIEELKLKKLIAE